MKKFLCIFPIIFVIFVQLSAICAEAKSEQKNNYEIRFETLAGTETADEFNKCKNELKNYFNKNIAEAHKKMYVKSLRDSDIDFNDETKIKSVKKYLGDEFPAMYLIAEKKLSELNYCWKINIVTDTTEICADIFPNIYGFTKETPEVLISGMVFGENNKWYITNCTVGKSTSKPGTTYYNYNYDFYKKAEKNTRMSVDADNSDKIKVCFIDVDAESPNRNGAVIYINDNPEYIVIDIGMENFPAPNTGLSEDTPKDIMRSLLISPKYAFDTINFYGFDYDKCIKYIDKYMKYRNPEPDTEKLSEMAVNYFAKNKDKLKNIISNIPEISEIGEEIKIAVSEPFKVPVFRNMIYKDNNYSCIIFADGKASAIISFDVQHNKIYSISDVVYLPESISADLENGGEYSILNIDIQKYDYGRHFKNSEKYLFAAGKENNSILLNENIYGSESNKTSAEKYINDKNIYLQASEYNVISKDMPIIAGYTYKRSKK